jgi:hypothetical protein
VPAIEAAEGGARVWLDDAESVLLRRLVAELRGLLRGHPARGDPVIARLFPDAYEDAEDAAAFRELIEDDLRREKLDAVEAMDGHLGDAGSVDITLGRDDGDRWLSVLTDLRLAIGTRLNVDEDAMSSEPDPSDPEGFHLSVIHWLGWLQEELIRTLSNSPPRADT